MSQLKTINESKISTRVTQIMKYFFWHLGGHFMDFSKLFMLILILYQHACN